MRCYKCLNYETVDVNKCFDCYGGSNFEQTPKTNCCHIIGLDYDNENEIIVSTSFSLDIRNHYIIKAKQKEIFNFCPRCGKTLKK
jgi:hypothetical protein